LECAVEQARASLLLEGIRVSAIYGAIARSDFRLSIYLIANDHSSAGSSVSCGIRIGHGGTHYDILINCSFPQLHNYASRT
jgi:hypothetical protein